MNTTQALVAIGGKAQRLRSSGIGVPISKSFMRVRGKPLLHWNLLSLYAAGVSRLVLCGDTPLSLYEATFVVDNLGIRFEHVEYFQDPGLGVHGLPYQASRHLDEQFVFDCGHSLMPPEHYHELDRRKVAGNIVFSAFRPHPVNLRQPVVLENNSVRLLTCGPSFGFALAHPMIVDRGYIKNLPRLRFDVREVIAHYAERRNLCYAHSDMPPEFDVAAEYHVAISRYNKYLSDHILPNEAAYVERHRSARPRQVSEVI
ncbi:MAG: hypothetical protein HOW97_26400 [Catenulispora sp.]|nr:hypothetical protein [Catenulispora sp.]